MNVRRVSDPYSAESAYEVTSEAGLVFRVAKEFYADGPSMYEWRIHGPGPLDQEARNTKRACLKAIEDQA